MLPTKKRVELFSDMHILGETTEAVTSPFRINYPILDNTNNYHHAKVYLRYRWESPEALWQPAWFYFKETEWNNPKWELSEKHFELAMNIKHKLENLKMKSK